MYRVLRVVAPFDSKIKRTLHKQRRHTPQQKEEKFQHIEGITIELPFEEEMAKNEANR